MQENEFEAYLAYVRGDLTLTEFVNKIQDQEEKVGHEPTSHCKNHETEWKAEISWRHDQILSCGKPGGRCGIPPRAVETMFPENRHLEETEDRV